MKMEPAANIIPRTFPAQFHELAVTYPSVPLTVESYNSHHCRVTPQRILPPPELDCILTTAHWSPPFPVRHDQLSRYRSFAGMADSRESSVEDCTDAVIPVTSVELRAHAADGQNHLDEQHKTVSDYEDVAGTLYEMKHLSPTFASMPACEDRDARATTVLPPVQSSHCVRTSEEQSSDVAARLASGEEDDSVPPLVRFKNRYRRALQQEVEQRQHCEITRDWNHNETCEVKTRCSPLKDIASSDHDSVWCSVNERSCLADETRPCEKRTWSRITPEVDLSDQQLESSKIPCRDGTLESARIEVYSQSRQAENDLRLKRYQQIHQRNLECQNQVVMFSEQPKFNPDGRLDIFGANKMRLQETAPLPPTPLNLSHRLEDCVYDEVEAVDLSVKTSSPANTCSVSPATGERRHNADPTTRPTKCTSDRNQSQGVDCLIDIARVGADILRKSELIQNKTAVLNDKERELRLLELKLTARERAISLQERHMTGKSSSKHTAQQSGSSWQHAENPNWQQAERYRFQLSAQELAQYHRTAAVLDHRQHVRPPDGHVQVTPAGWAMEKLEEQFAKLAYTRTTDALPQHTDIVRTQACLQEPAKIEPRPELVPLHQLNTASHHSGPMHEHSNTIRKRGRPKGSKNRYKMKIPSETATVVAGLPIRQQWMRNLYMHAQTLHNNSVTTSAAEEAVRRSLAHQMMVDCRPAGMMADSCRSAVRVFTNGQQLSGQQMGPCFEGRQSSDEPPPPLLLAREQSTAPPTVMPTRVQQLLASAAFTTGASILPPLSPIQTSEFSTSLPEYAAGHASVPRDSFQQGSNSDDNSVMPTEDAVAGHYGNASSEQSTDRTIRHPEAHRNQALSTAAVNDLVESGCNPVMVHSRRETSHILPKVSLFETGHCCNSEQVEREEALYKETDSMSTVRSITIDDDDDAEDRLVVVLDGN